MNIELVCDGCGARFERLSRQHRNNLRRGRTIVACSNACVNLARKHPDKVVRKTCEECGESFSRKPSGTDKLKYCTRKCSAAANGRARRKESKPIKHSLCVVCGERSTVAQRGKYCALCKSLRSSKSKKNINTDTATLGELKQEYSTAQYHAKLRGWARSVYRAHNKEMSCANCGYSLHIDVCHITPVSDFSMDTKISTVNSIENLIGLDKRCHWEFDNGFLSLELESN